MAYLDDAHGDGEALRADGRDDQVPLLRMLFVYMKWV